MDEDIRNRISDFYDNLKTMALQKFDKGRKEHGENFEEINYEFEIIQEITDIVNYLAMHDYVRNRRNNLTDTGKA